MRAAGSLTSRISWRGAGAVCVVKDSVASQLGCVACRSAQALPLPPHCLVGFPNWATPARSYRVPTSLGPPSPSSLPLCSAHYEDEATALQDDGEKSSNANLD